MRFIGWVAAVSLFAACGVGRVQHDTAMEFGDVAIGESRKVALVLTSGFAQRVDFELTAGTTVYALDRAVFVTGPSAVQSCSQ